MASFTAAGDSTTLLVPAINEQISVAISGTYAQTIDLQKEVGALSSGAWRTLSTYSTANATVADTYYTKEVNENLRLFARSVTSGTAVATLTDSSDLTIREVKDSLGNVMLTYKQSGISVPLALRGPVPATTLTAAATLTDVYAGRPIVLDNSTGFTVTLPAATGTGNRYNFWVKTTVASGSMIIQVANATDVMRGISIAVDNTIFAAATTSDTITFNGGTTGGVSGTMVNITDVASGYFSVVVFESSSSTEATPFSAAVS